MDARLEEGCPDCCTGRLHPSKVQGVDYTSSVVRTAVRPSVLPLPLFLSPTPPLAAISLIAGENCFVARRSIVSSSDKARSNCVFRSRTPFPRRAINGITGSDRTLYLETQRLHLRVLCEFGPLFSNGTRVLRRWSHYNVVSALSYLPRSKLLILHCAL